MLRPLTPLLAQLLEPDLRRPYRDAQGRTWLYSGHHSFQLLEQGPDRNVIRVEAP